MYDIQTKNLLDRRELLRIKAHTLIAETSIIRNAETKQKRFGRKQGWVAMHPMLLNEMVNHRKTTVRRQSRLTSIALGFIQGKTLPQIEPYVKNLLTHEDWKDIKAMCQKYGAPDLSTLTFAKAQEEQFKGKSYGTKPQHVFKQRLQHDQQRKVLVAE